MTAWRRKGALTGPIPTDGAKAGRKHHLLVEAHGPPLSESVTAANVHDTHELFPLVDSVLAVRMPSGQRRRRPGKLHGDKAYASKKNRALAWKNQLHRLRVRDERRDDVHFGFLVLGCCVMLLRRLYPDIC
ncbi:transposase [Corallococcus sp. ZKHCc1 1396]|uniref:Transposase n=1 Tax=Corallococcus soli TaxID=2710757 RepID=A0ABR9PU12_9BACT|nr:transposase [Corallococcus soli]MBE4751408.1 transposase [Corallococcus soli]